jgi:DnaJ-class molecular chaperone
MVKEYELRQECWRCDGTGVFQTYKGEELYIEDPCTVCGGSGYIVLGYMEKL